MSLGRKQSIHRYFMDSHKSIYDQILRGLVSFTEIISVNHFPK